MSEPKNDQALRDVLEPLAGVPRSADDSRRRVWQQLERSLETPPPGPPPANDGGASGVTTTQAATMTVLGTLGGVAVGVLAGFWMASGPTSGPEPLADPDVVEAAESEPIEANAVETPAGRANVEEPAFPMASDLTDPEERATDSSDLRARPTGRSNAPREDPPPGPSSLEAERRLIDAAFAAFRGQDHAEATRALDRHQARFPDGVLSQERETLRDRLASTSP